MDKKPWYKQRTTRTAIGTILAAVGGMLTGTVEPSIAIGGILLSLQQIFHRQGTEKNK